MTAAHAAPVVVHGWTLYAHPLFLAQLETLASQVEALTQERDSLKSRLGAARARVEALLDRLPEAQGLAASPQHTIKPGP
jgi:outer membrane murein-binding lipoprotein Lpp